MRIRNVLTSWLAGGALIAGLSLALPAVGRAKLSDEFGAVATEHPLASRAAKRVLERGGDAADAMVAAALTAGVVSPTSSGLGGGGFAMIWRPGDREPTVLDFREVAPQAVDRAALERRPLPFAERGHLIGVPGEARGLFEMSRRFGKRPWAELVNEARLCAAQGFVVGKHLARTLSGSSAAVLREDPGLAALYFRGGRAAVVGQNLKNTKLAETLRRLGAEGTAAIYDGRIAAEIVSGARAVGSPLTLADLAAYRVIERHPLRVTWSGYDVFTMPPPSAGGVLLAQTLGLFRKEELARLGFQSAAYQHLLAEAFRASLADRFLKVGDPDFVPTDVAALLRSEHLRQIKSRLALDRTHTLPLLAQEEHGTHHLVITDREGMIVSLTTTVNRVFGAKLLLPDSGIVLNDELDDFTRARDAAALGLAESPNAPRPGARPVSSMTPTIVLRDGRPLLALGGSGGMAIATNVTQVLLHRLVFDGAPEALVQAPRFFVPPGGSNTILLEEGAPALLRDELAYRGERVGTMPADVTAVQLIVRDGQRWRAVADPRKFGSALPEIQSVPAQ